MARPLRMLGAPVAGGPGRKAPERTSAASLVEPLCVRITPSWSLAREELRAGLKTPCGSSPRAAEMRSHRFRLL